MSEQITIDLDPEQVAQLRESGQNLEEQVHRSVRLYLLLTNPDELLAERQLLKEDGSC